MWKRVVQRGVAAILAASMSLGLIGIDKALAKEVKAAPERIIQGDWDGNGVLELTDVKHMLRAALRLEPATDLQCYVNSEYGYIRLEDVKTALRTVLNLQEKSYIEMVDSRQMGTVYDEVIEREFGMTLRGAYLWESKEQALDFLKAYPHSYEKLKQAIADMKEEELEGNAILLYADRVCADSEEHAGIKKIYKKDTEYAIMGTFEMEDSSEVTGEKNYLYIGVRLLPEEFGEIEIWDVGFEHNAQDVKADISSSYMDAPPAGKETLLPSYEVITSVQEAQKVSSDIQAAYREEGADESDYWTDLWDVLKMDASYYEQYTRILYKGSAFAWDGPKKLDWAVSGGALEVFFDCTNWQTREDLLPDYPTEIRYYIIDLKKDLVGGREIVFHASEHTEEVYLPGEQQHFTLEPQGDYYHAFWFGIGNEEQRTHVLDTLGEKFGKTGQSSYKELEDTIKAADIDAYDVMVAFGVNQEGYKIEETDEGAYKEKVLAAVFDKGVKFDYSQRGRTFEPGKQIVSVLYLPKGSLEPYLSEWKNEVPEYGQDDKTELLMTIMGMDKENKKIFLQYNGWTDAQFVLNLTEQTKITCNDKEYEVGNLHAGDIVKLDFVENIGMNPSVLQGNSFVELIYCVETKEAYKGLTAQQLQEKFPHNAYWNHPVGDDHVEEGYEAEDTGKCNNPDGYTWHPCKLGEYGCNSYADTELCYGFAAKLAYDVYGSTYYEWSRQQDSIKNVKPGDVIFYHGNGAGVYGHRAMVIDVNGTKLQLAECNWNAHCKISWGRWTDAANFREYTLYPAPFELPGGGEGVLD